MGEQVELNENGSEIHKQLGANFDVLSTSSEIMPAMLTMNGAFKAQINGEVKDSRTMEGCAERNELLENQKFQRHRPLTFLRILRGVLCLMVLVSTALMTLIMFAPITFLTLRLVSLHYSRKATSFLFGHWLAMWPFLFEKINKTKVIFSGDHVPPRERILLLSNHRTEVDWMYIWDLALRKDRLGYIKYVLKSSVRNAPIFGWGFHILEFILVERKWELDEPVIESMLSTFKDPRDPLWLVLFPEGTDFTEQKCLRSQRFAEEHDLPILNNVLLPRTKGFFSCLTLLRSSLDAVYDVTIGYKYRCPLFMDNAFGVDPAEVHVHVRRVPLSEIPSSEDEAAAWLIEAFRIKDGLLCDFSNKGSFPNSGTEDELPTFKCILNFTMMIILTVISLTLTFFNSIYLKIYVALSCVYLAASTYFNVRPMPIFNCIKVRNTGSSLNQQEIH